MLEFGFPWALALLPLPLIVRWLLRPARESASRALQVPDVRGWALAAGRVRRGVSFWSLLAAVLAWLLLVAAATRPQWLGDEQSMPVSGRDLMMAIDVSGSMGMRDFGAGTRLDATKQVAAEFISRREGDRVGLILFGKQAYLQTPLTFDRRTVTTQLLESFVGIAGRETAIGDAIGLALKRLRERPSESRVLILLTDGANTAGAIEPLRAAQLAAGEGLRIYTVGIGSDGRETRQLFGLLRNNQGTDLDEETLQGIADATGGRYFRARSANELREIYSVLNELEPLDHETVGFRPLRAMYMWPLAASMIFAGFAAALRVWRG